jgi:hypothetical protein
MTSVVTTTEWSTIGRKVLLLGSGLTIHVKKTGLVVVGRLSTYITVCEVAVHSAADISLYLFHDSSNSVSSLSEAERKGIFLVTG